MECPICGNKISLGFKVKILDGVVCADCAAVCPGYKSSTIEQLCDYCVENNNRVKAFEKSGEISTFGSKTIVIDSTNRMFYIAAKRGTPFVYLFDEVIEYRYEKVGEKTITKTKGGISRAVVGSLIAGPVGAIVGTNTSKKETTTKGGTNLLKVGINSFSGKRELSMPNPPTGFTAFLDQCIDGLEKNGNEHSNIQSSSPADELLKWKNLLDQGAISNDEFEAKKRQLLGC